jgi:hypothetical protein
MLYHVSVRPFVSTTVRDSTEHKYLKVCLLLAHMVKKMGLAPHIIFYLKFSKFWTKEKNMCRVHKIMFFAKGTKGGLRKLESKFRSKD